MDLLYILFSAIAILVTSCYGVATQGQSPQSHWCPTIEVRRVACVKNVSLGREPASLRRVYQWKKEMVMRCCPGFMGPNCEKACFSCRHWAEMVGKVHHLEQYLQQQMLLRCIRSKSEACCPSGLEKVTLDMDYSTKRRMFKPGVSSGGSRVFQPFTPDPSANTVCWTKEGRPVYGHISPPDVGRGERMPGRRGGGQESERSRIYVRNGGQSAHVTNNGGTGCPIHTTRREDNGNSPSHQPTGRAQQERHRRRQTPRVPVSVNVRGRRQDSPPSGITQHTQQSARSTYYQKHPPLASNRKSLAPNYHRGVVGVAPGKSSRTASGPKPAMKQIIRRRSDVTDEDLADIRRRYSRAGSGQADGESVYENRLSILERQMVELERKLSALSPALTTISSMEEEIDRLTKQVDTLQARVQGDETPQHPPSHQSSLTPADQQHRKSDLVPGRLIPQHLDMRNNTRTRRVQQQQHETHGHNVSTTSMGTTQDCPARCKELNPSPPLPDKDVVQALFPDSPHVTEALDKGPERFYQEVKKAIVEDRTKIDRKASSGQLGTPGEKRALQNGGRNPQQARLSSESENKGQSSLSNSSSSKPEVGLGGLVVCVIALIRVVHGATPRHLL